MNASETPCYIIAEAGVNHNGSEELAFKMVDAALLAGVDAVKFQTFRTEKLVTRNASKAAYQAERTGAGGQFAMLKALELSDAAHRRLASYCVDKGMEFLSTPFDEESANFLIELGCQRIKVPSGELTNTPFLSFLAAKGLPLILSTGMATLTEVAEAVSVIEEVRKSRGFPEPLEEILTLLHCTSSYPTLLADVNMRAMCSLASVFGLPVGYSDHTDGIFVAPIARALGAQVVEKHFTLDRKLPGPDHKASLEPNDLSAMVKAVRAVETILGSAEKKPSTSELEVRIAARRSITMAVDAPVGTTLTCDMLTLLRPGDGIAPKYFETVVGRNLKSSMKAGDTLHWEDLSE